VTGVVSAGARAAAVMVATAVVACGETPGAPDFIPPPERDPVIVGAGDIGNCTTRGAELTAALLDVVGGQVFTAGDNAYPHGTFADYMRCYDPHWGRHKHRTLPAPGNHEYETPGAIGYFRYFDTSGGPDDLGYYSAFPGRWMLLSLNSNIDASAGSRQVEWLRSSLEQFRGRCVIAIWHHPLISSGPNGGSREMLEVWRILSEAGADVVVNGHEHLYERFTHLDAQLQPAERGIRQFVVGTGGTPLSRVHTVRRGSRVQASVWGVLKLTLRPESYEWEFIPAEPGAFHDQGQDGCR
jgi:hypothetical protein